MQPVRTKIEQQPDGGFSVQFDEATTESVTVAEGRAVCTCGVLNCLYVQQVRAVGFLHDLKTIESSEGEQGATNVVALRPRRQLALAA